MTYNLHILLRFRLERALLSGDLAVADLPGAWRRGVRPAAGRGAAGRRRRGRCRTSTGAWAASATSPPTPWATCTPRSSSPPWSGRSRRCAWDGSGGISGPILDWLRRNVHAPGRSVPARGAVPAGHRRGAGPAAFPRLPVGEVRRHLCPLSVPFLANPYAWVLRLRALPRRGPGPARARGARGAADPERARNARWVLVCLYLSLCLAAALGALAADPRGELRQRGTLWFFLGGASPRLPRLPFQAQRGGGGAAALRRPAGGDLAPPALPAARRRGDGSRPGARALGRGGRPGAGPRPGRPPCGGRRAWRGAGSRPRSGS